MIGILLGLLALGCLICWVIVLIKQFQTAGVVHGIIGIICGLWTFIWGWMNANNLGIKNIMMIWTLLIILYFVLSLVFGASMIPYGMPTNQAVP